MRIGIVGGGERCLHLLELMAKHRFEELSPKVVVVAEESEAAPGVVKARENGIVVTRDYRDLLERDDLDLIVVLVGDQEIFEDILLRKKSTVRAIGNETAQLFLEVSRVSSIRRADVPGPGESRTMYDVVMNDLIQEDIMVIGPSYRIVDVNDNMLRKLGRRRKDVVGKYCYEISHRRETPCDGRAHPCPLLEALKTRKPSQATHVHLDRNMHEIYYSISCYPIFDSGKVMGAVELSKDITKDINIQKSMMQQQKLASIGQLAAGVAHEINNPLTTILTTALLIQEDLDGNDPNHRELQTIADETLRCRKLVTSLLDFARQSRPTMKAHDINAIARESMVLTRKQAAFKDVALVEALQEDIPHTRVDKDQIQQSLINLILNAVEASDAGGTVTVATAWLPSEEVIEISVADTGEGIAEEHRDKIFEPFFTTKDSGTGLGLAIIHGLIQQHGGKIQVRSAIGRGTTMTIQLPLAGKGPDHVD